MITKIITIIGGVTIGFAIVILLGLIHAWKQFEPHLTFKEFLKQWLYE